MKFKWPRFLARTIGASLARYTGSNPDFRVRLIKLLKRFPRLEHRLRVFYEQQIGSGSTQTITLDQLKELVSSTNDGQGTDLDRNFGAAQLLCRQYDLPFEFAGIELVREGARINYDPSQRDEEVVRVICNAYAALLFRLPSTKEINRQMNTVRRTESFANVFKTIRESPEFAAHGRAEIEL